MPKKHPHCEVIKAWADGAQIQAKSRTGDWRDILNPTFHVDTEYRVKPETIKYRVALFDFSYGKTPAIAQTQWQADSWEDMASFVRWLTDWVEVEV